MVKLREWWSFYLWNCSWIGFGDGSVCNNVAQIRLCGQKNAQLIKYFADRRHMHMKEIL